MRRRIGSGLGLVALFAIVALRLSGTVGAQSALPVFTVSSASVIPGQTITVASVNGCAPGGSVELTLDDVDGDPVGGEEYPVAVTGAWGGQFTVPPDTEAGQYTLEAACWASDDAEELSARYAPVTLVVGRSPGPCPPDLPTIVGSPGPDRLFGTPGNDVIHGLDGVDQIAGLGGDDILCGGLGDDDLTGGDGDDRLFGEAGADRLTGGNDQDIVDGGPGNDRLSGGPGGDELIDGSGADHLAGDGDDVMDTKDLSGGDILAGAGACRTDPDDQILTGCIR